MKSKNPIKLKEIFMLLPAFEDPFGEVFVLDPVEPATNNISVPLLMVL